MKIATTTWELIGYTKSTEEAVRFYEGTGFRYLDYSFFNAVTVPNHPFMTDAWRDDILASKAAADELGFKFVQAHAPAFDFRGDRAEAGLLATIRSIEACGILGIKNIVVHSGGFPEYKYPEDKLDYFKANEPFFKALIPAMEENGVSVLIENIPSKHFGDGNYVPIRGKDLADMVDYMNHPLFGAIWDVGHAHIDGLDHYSEIMDIGDRLKAIHVHDNDAKGQNQQTPLR